MVEVKYRGTDLSQEEKDGIWEVLCQCDDEFYPPLSARNSSSQKQLKSEDGSAMAREQLPVAYYEEMIRQEFLVAADEGKVVGFMTFKKNYICDALEFFGESLYITTVCVRREYRGRHILGMLYDYMETEAARACGCSRVSTRTWSLNEAQLHDLKKRGYERLAVLKDDRGPGVDTIYFGICLDQEEHKKEA